MKIRVLGSGAGGGIPQWNCHGEVSRAVRSGALGTSPRTQSSLAVSADGEHWFLLNASPDLGEQIRKNSVLHPRGEALRHSPIQGVVLTNGDVDHVAGLLVLRESHPLVLYGTERVLGFLGENSIFNVLSPHYVQRQALSLGQSFPLRDARGDMSGVMVEAFAVSGKVALWQEDESKGDNFGSEEGDTIALKLWREGAEQDAWYYIPACAAMTPDLARRLTGASLVFFDGTLWRDDEMIIAGVGTKTGRRMGHMSQTGEHGTLRAFADLGVKRKILIHINTTNPIIIEGSEENRKVRDAGWEIAYDGMEIG
ncbi:MAG: pyrroloquinoline quinone biosynthesis protein PqqB [Alphaproteobacteria bacterium GM7ARS4]|nr:pyrroloquinoline quinone biosynthesis protein PqqB [Alphaproteobacteria bacterium GM7ARS4]